MHVWAISAVPATAFLASTTSCVAIVRPRRGPAVVLLLLLPFAWTLADACCQAPAALLCKALSGAKIALAASGIVPGHVEPVSRPLLLTGSLSAGMLYMLAWERYGKLPLFTQPITQTKPLLVRVLLGCCLDKWRRPCRRPPQAGQYLHVDWAPLTAGTWKSHHKPKSHIWLLCPQQQVHDNKEALLTAIVSVCSSGSVPQKSISPFEVCPSGVPLSGVSLALWSEAAPLEASLQSALQPLLLSAML